MSGESKKISNPNKEISPTSKEVLFWKKKYAMLLLKHKKVVGALKEKLEELIKKSKTSGGNEDVGRLKNEIQDLRSQLDFERSQKISLQSQMHNIGDRKPKMPNLDFDSLAQTGGVSTEQMMKFREALESQLKNYSEMLANAEARASKNDIEISKKDKLNQKLTHQVKKLEERNKEIQSESKRIQGSLVQYQNLYEELKKEVDKRDLEAREVHNKKEDEIIELKKEVRTHLNKIEDLEHQVHAFDTIKIATEIGNIISQAKSLTCGDDPEKIYEILEKITRIKFEMKDFDRTVEQKFVNLSYELDQAEAYAKQNLVEKFAS